MSTKEGILISLRNLPQKIKKPPAIMEVGIVDDQNSTGQAVNDGDMVQKAMGDFGRWQIIICVAVSLCKVSVAWHQLSIIFLAPPQDFWCARPPGLSNVSVAWWKNISSPEVGVTPGHRACHHFNLSESDYEAGLGVEGRVATPFPPSTSLPCSAWEFDDSMFTQTIIAEWQLVCGQGMLVHLAQTVYMFGILAGNFIFGILSDRYGRKKPLLASVFIQVVGGTLTAFSTNYFMFTLFRFLDAFATGGAMVTSFVILMEIVGIRWRSFVAIMYHIPFAVGHLTLPAVAYLFRSWRHYQLAISLPSIFLLSYYWLVPESPRWLLSTGRTDAAVKILRRATTLNRLPTRVISDMLIHRAEHGSGNEGEPEKASFLDLLRHRNLRIKTLCISFNWLVCGVCFFGLAQFMGTIAGNIFINVAAGGAIEIPGSFLCMYTLEKFGRKRTLMVSLLTSGLACLIIIFIPQGQDAAAWPTVALSLVGVVGMSVAFPTVYLFSGELFPTVVRNMGIGFASMCARIGSMAAPFISGLNSYGAFVPPLVFGIFPLVGCILCLFLPETANTNLPETIQDGEDAGAANSNRKKIVTGISNSTFQQDTEGTK